MKLVKKASQDFFDKLRALLLQSSFAMLLHSKNMCHFLAPSGQPEMMHKNFMRR